MFWKWPVITNGSTCSVLVCHQCLSEALILRRVSTTLRYNRQNIDNFIAIDGTLRRTKNFVLHEDAILTVPQRRINDVTL